MLKTRWFHHFKAGLIAVCILLGGAAAAGLLLLNQRGFEGQWGERIATELSRRGVYADFDTVRFSPMRGIIARRVVLYKDKSRRNVLAHIPRLRFEVDRAKALRGELQIRRVIIHDAHLALPITSGGKEKLHLTGLSGRASLDRQNRLILEGARGTLRGMTFNLEVLLDEFELTQVSQPSDPEAIKRRDDFVAALLNELEHWSFPDDAPPELAFRITGSAQRPASIRSSFSIAASQLSRHAYQMRDVLLTGELHGRTLSVDRVRFSDRAGKLNVRASYDLEDKRGRFNGKSSIKIADLLRQALDNHSLDEIISDVAPEIEARGQFTITDDGLKLGAIGTLAMKRFQFLGIPLRGLQTDFSWQDGDIFLRELMVKHEEGELSGQILLKDETILYRTKSSLPLSAYRAFLKPDSGLERALLRSKFSEHSKIQVEASGYIPRNDLREWKAQGVATFQNFSYNQIPMLRATARFDIDPLGSYFSDIEIDFDYDANPLHQWHGGPRSAVLQAERVHYDHQTNLVHLGNLRGTVWPGPVLRLFTSRAADYIEQTYLFRAPPEFHASGQIDTRRPATRTDVKTRVQTSGLTDYKFLGKTLQLIGLSATVRTRPWLHDVTDLKFRTLGGAGSGMVTVQPRPERTTAVAGRITLDGVDVDEVAQNYELKSRPTGTLTAQVEFNADSTLGAQGDPEWVTRGNAIFGESLFNDVPIANGRTQFEVTRLGSRFSNLQIEFDYRDYLMRRRHGGPSSAPVQAEALHFDKRTRLVRISKLRGTAWPGPILRLVSPRAARHVEEGYGFRRPPEFSAGGTVDTGHPSTRTDLTTHLRAQGTTDYDFLDRTLQLTGVSATIRSRPPRHDVSKLAFQTFSGSGAGSVTVHERPDRTPIVEGGIKWNDLRLVEIGQKYDFEKAAHGTITGRIDFTAEPGNSRALKGRGVVGLRNGQLFHVPIFGPLSLPIGGILGKKFSHEQARNASATFVIKNGKAHTNDFLTSTTSTVFTGEGYIDLVTKHLDLTVRMNARGLLGLVTLPLLPLNGLFQFRGEGPLKRPTWSSSPFTQPTRGANDPIFREPPRAQIVPEP